MLSLVAEIVEVCKTAHTMCGIIIQTDAIAHEMIQRVLHMQRTADFHPFHIIVRIIKTGDIALIEIENDLQEDRAIVDCEALENHLATVSAVDAHAYASLPLIIDMNAHGPEAALQGDQPCPVAGAHTGWIEQSRPRANRSFSSLRQRIAGLQDAIDDTPRLKPQPAWSDHQRPQSVVRIMIPLPIQDQLILGIFELIAGD